MSQVSREVLLSLQLPRNVVERIPASEGMETSSSRPPPPWRAPDLAAVGVMQVPNATAANEGKSESAAAELPARGLRHASVMLRGSSQHIWALRREAPVTHQLPFSTVQKNANTFQKH